MPYTDFPNGLTSFGVPLPGGPLLYRANGKRHIWVSGISSGVGAGNDGNSGDSPDSPFRTMDRAFDTLASGDTIHVWGNVREQLSAPAGIFDVTIIGEGNRPRHADAHTDNNGYFTPTWKAPASPTTATPLLKVRQQGWRFINMLWVPPTDAAALQFIRDAASGDDERDSSHADVVGCRFAAGKWHIQIVGTENVFDVRVKGNIFNDATTTSIAMASAYAHRWIFEDNIWQANVNHVVGGFTASMFLRNTFGSFTTLSLSLAGGGGLNVITGNYLSGTYGTPQYEKSNANDEWAGNFNSLSGGITAADPA